MQVNKLDWLVFNAALFGVMFAGVEIGLAIAIGLSFVLAILKVAFPRTAILGHLPGTNVYRSGTRREHTASRLRPGHGSPTPAMPLSQSASRRYIIGMPVQAMKDKCEDGLVLAIGLLNCTTHRTGI